jgi:hypothetical protein
VHSWRRFRGFFSPFTVGAASGAVKHPTGYGERGVVGSVDSVAS